MKRQNTALSVLLTASISLSIACGSGTGSSSTSDSTNLPQAEIIQSEETNGGAIVIESTKLFEELKGDIPSLTEKYEGKRILIKNLLLAGGFTKTGTSGTRRKIFCVPVSADLKKMGYLHPDYAAQIEHIKSYKESYACWRPNGYGRESMDASNSAYYLGNTKLVNLFDHVQESNNILIEATLQTASDYPAMKLPSMHLVSDIIDGVNPNYLMSFTETFDMECTVSSLSGGSNSGEGIYVYDAVILNKRPFPATDIANLAKQSKTNAEKAQQESQVETESREIVGQWNGKAGSQAVEINIQQDFGESIEASVDYNGGHYIVEGNKAKTPNGWKISFSSNDEEGGVKGELIYDFKKSTSEMTIRINSAQGKLIKQ